MGSDLALCGERLATICAMALPLLVVYMHLKSDFIAIIVDA
jgi:hypothetical protein